MMITRTVGLCVLAVLLAGCVRVNVHGTPRAWIESMAETRELAPPVRVATYNTSLYDDAAGGTVATMPGATAGTRGNTGCWCCRDIRSMTRRCARSSC